jgi:hypothetical protein
MPPKLGALSPKEVIRAWRRHVQMKHPAKPGEGIA